MSNGDRRTTCVAAGCGRDSYARGWCAMHYKRWLRTGTPTRGAERAECDVDGCTRPAKSRRLVPRPLPTVADPWRCARGSTAARRRPLLARRLRSPAVRARAVQHPLPPEAQHRYPRPEEPIRVVTGAGYDDHGYWQVSVPAEERWLTGGAYREAEHRLIMARRLGRPLHPDESVHHINGDRTDNREENLELWSTSHPSGQRVIDKIAHAMMLLARYAPHLVHRDRWPPAPDPDDDAIRHALERSEDDPGPDEDRDRSSCG